MVAQILLVLGLVVGACGSEDAVAEGGASACSVGDTRLCTGPGGCVGGQACLADRSGYGACDCGLDAGSEADASDGNTTDGEPDGTAFPPDLWMCYDDAFEVCHLQNRTYETPWRQIELCGSTFFSDTRSAFGSGCYRWLCDQESSPPPCDATACLDGDRCWTSPILAYMCSAWGASTSLHWEDCWYDQAYWAGGCTAVAACASP